MLTAKQHSFVLGWVDNLTANPDNKQTQTQIAVNAGYSERSAHSTASDLLKNPKIIRAIEDELTKQGMGKNEVLYHFAKIARGDVKDATLGDRLRALENMAKYHNLTTSSTTRIEDWKSDAIQMIKDGLIDFAETKLALEHMGHSESLADELFRLAGVPVESD